MVMGEGGLWITVFFLYRNQRAPHHTSLQSHNRIAISISTLAGHQQHQAQHCGSDCAAAGPGPWSLVPLVHGATEASPLQPRLQQRVRVRAPAAAATRARPPGRRARPLACRRLRGWRRCWRRLLLKRETLALPPPPRPLLLLLLLLLLRRLALTALAALAVAVAATSSAAAVVRIISAAAGYGPR